MPAACARVHLPANGPRAIWGRIISGCIASSAVADPQAVNGLNRLYHGLDRPTGICASIPPLRALRCWRCWCQSSTIQDEVGKIPPGGG